MNNAAVALHGGDASLYLHFLDRELTRSVMTVISGEVADKALRCLLLSTTSPLFAGLSLAWESEAMHGDFQSTFAHAIQSQALELVSHHLDLGEFLETRRSLYQHDAERYPMYFEPLSEVRSHLRPTVYKESSTTAVLASGLSAWASNDIAEVGNARERFEPLTLRAIRLSLARREDQAITFALFAGDLGKTPPALSNEGKLRRKISLDYTNHYMGNLSADIPTGILGLSYFDQLSRQFPHYDVPLLAGILDALGWAALTVETSDSVVWRDIAAWRAQPKHLSFRQEIRVLLEALYRVARDVTLNGQMPTIAALRTSMAGELRFAMQFLPTDKHAPKAGDFIAAFGALHQVILGLSGRAPYASILEDIRTEMGMNACDVLLVTATTTERDAVLGYCNFEARADNVIFGSRRTYFDLGNIGGARVAMVQSEMGASTPGGSHATIIAAIEDLHPESIIMVGIAFGVDDTKQRIGQVLVSSQIRNYDISRQSTSADGELSVEMRGDRVTAAPRLLSRFRASTVTTGCDDAKFGLLLCGDKLIDNIGFRNDLLRLEPDAIGGEMEGSGMYAAAMERNVDWIIVKAICDFADGDKGRNKALNQKQAVDASVPYVIETIRQGGFIRTSARTAGM